MAALDARVIAHRIRNDFAVMAGLLELFNHGAGLTDRQHADLAQMLITLDSLSTAFNRMHSLVRGIAPGPLPEQA